METKEVMKYYGDAFVAMRRAESITNGMTKWASRLALGFAAASYVVMPAERMEATVAPAVAAVALRYINALGSQRAEEMQNILLERGLQAPAADMES